MTAFDTLLRELIRDVMREELVRLRAEIRTPAPGPDVRPQAGVAASLVDHVWLSTREAMTYTGRSVVTVHRHAAAGTLRSVQAGRGRGRRYRREWLDAWMTGTR